MGFRDPTAFCVIAYDWDSETYYLVDEYKLAEKSTEIHAERIKEMIDKWDMDYIYMDSAAQQTRFDLAEMYEISTINAKKSAIIDNDKLVVHSGCAETLAAIDQYQWDPNPNLLREKPIHNDASHMADAMRYALYSFQTSMVEF